MPMMKFKNSKKSFFNSIKLIHFVILGAIASLVFTFTNCAPPAHDDLASEKIGNYESPFAKDKLLLQTPTSKIVRTKTTAQREAFDADKDAIPASVMMSMSCAAVECANLNDGDVGRLTCYGYNQALKQQWPAQVNRYSFSFKFKKGESIDDIRAKFESDAIDQKCIVGIADYAEMHLTERPNDPDIALTNSTYASSPYLDQVGFIDNTDFIASLKIPLQSIRVGVVDGDFYGYYSDLSGNFDTNLKSYYKNFRIDQSYIVNVGGAMLPNDCNSGCHGTWVSQLIAGTNGNQTMGAGIAAGVNSQNSDLKIIAANVYSVDSASGSKIITVDSVNNAIALMAYLKVDVINLSLGYEDTANSGGPQTLLQAILSAIGQGSVVVASAGNNSVNMTTKKKADGTDAKYITFPGAWGADYLGLISVAAMNAGGNNLALFSSYGHLNVDIAAPGEALMIGGKSMSGTSFSAPLVSGAVALTKAYYRSQMGAQAEISAAQVELSFLAGSKKLDSISGFVKNGLTLNLNTLKQQLTSQTLSVAPSAKLDNDGFWFTRSGSSMTYGIRAVTSNIPEGETTLFIGIWEKLDMNLPPLAQFNATNGTNNFELPFYHFLVGDNGFWIVLYRLTSDSKRIPISSKLYKFADLVQQPTVSESLVLGSINQINSDVSGWACLAGRPDRISVEVRTGAPDGPKVASQIVAHQPKGKEYFDNCAPFTVQLGFNFPISFFKKNVPYYIVAVHPSNPNKNKLLNSEPIIIEETQYADPMVHSIRKTIDANNVVVEGQVCWVDQTTPGIISNYYEPLMFEPGTGLNPKVKAWLEGIMQNHSTLYSNYTELVGTTVNGVTTYKTGRFILNGYKLGLYSGAWSSTNTGLNTFQVAPVNNFNAGVVNRQNVPFVDAIDFIGGYGVLPVAMTNDTSDAVYYKPFFVDAWQPSQTFEPFFTVGSAGSATNRDEIAPRKYLKASKPTYYPFVPQVNAHYLPAWDEPRNVHGSQLQTANLESACTSVGKTGIGQSFTITYARSVMIDNFVVSLDLTKELPVSAFNGLSEEQLTTLFNAFNQSYKSAVASSGVQLGKSIIDSGQVSFSLRFLSVTSGAKFEKFYLKDIPNR